MDQHLWLKSLFFHGPSLINSVVNDSSETQSVTKKQKILNFIRNNHEDLFQEKPPSFKKPPPFDPLPVELFWDCSIEQRRKLFFKHLERGDILLLKVINVELPEHYKLLVLGKHKCCMKLDDLSLLMYLPKLKQELDIVNGEVNNYDVLRAAVCSCSLHERKLFVTLDDTILDEDTEPVKLGKISTKELPSYVGKIQLPFSSYKSYYEQTSTFTDPNWANQMYDVLGLKKNYLYSFHKEWEGKQYPSAESGKILKLRHILWLSDLHYNKAVEYYQVENFTDAILCLNQSLAIYPQNKKALVSRGTLYFKTKEVHKAFLDTDKAVQLDPLYEPAQKQMSVLLVHLAKEHMEAKIFSKAKESLNTAIGFNVLNEEAKKLLLEVEEEEKKVQAAKLNKVSAIPTIINKSAIFGSPYKYKKDKKKKKRRRRSEEYAARKLFRYKSKSPKKRKSVIGQLKSVVNPVVQP